MSTTMTTTRRALVVLLLPLSLAALAACGNDDTESATADTAPVSTETTQAPAPKDVTITAVDYSFEGVPASVATGTQLSIRNESDVELHEVLAFRVPDGDDRSLADLMALPQAELTGLLGAPRAVLAQAPGSTEVIHAVGDGRLTEPGRYVLMCAIPLGADPEEYLAAAAASPGGPPQGVAGGPPHLVAGMVAELTVE